ncbi:MAG: NTP transferase domain-containing protein [Gammaproteobacteria bacterium]|nr:NTP transferase domain-containing protein [Gammaproteobacteria bacterium]
MDIPPQPAYPEPLDAIVLAGTDTNPRRMVEGQNKAFLNLGGEALVNRVVRTLLEAATIGNIYVVGPAQRLQAALAGLSPDIHIVEQSGGLMSNAWAAIRVSEARFRERSGGDDPLRPLLFISSDLPLISASAVDDFVLRCAHEDSVSDVKYAMLAGVAEESSLRQFYAEDDQEGIHRPYVNFSDCRLRLANIYVGRPRALSNQAFLETGFAHRKAEKLKNVMSLIWKFLGQSGGWRAAWFTFRLQLTLAASKKKGRLYRWLRSFNKTTDAERSCGDVLGGAVRIVITPYGGLSLDVDNDEDYQVLSKRFDDWRRLGPVEPPV